MLDVFPTPRFVATLALCILAFSAASAQESYGTIRATTKLRPDGTKATTIKDPDAHTAIETITDAKDHVLKKTTYLLDEGDMAMAAIFADSKGNVIYKASYQRDAVGRVTEASFTSADGRYLGKRVFVYGPTGDNATQTIDYDANGQMIAPKAVPKKKR
jgi:predicted enzyme related to lactoylglutathione lyase